MLTRNITVLLGGTLAIATAGLLFSMDVTTKEHDREILTEPAALHAVHVLPMMPERIRHPFGDADVRAMSGAGQVAELFDNADYHLPAVRAGNPVAGLFSLNLPDNLDAQNVDNKINDFIRILLPNVLAVNRQIMKVRHEIMRLAALPREGLSQHEKAWLAALGKDYGVNGLDIETLLLHLDVIPVGMVLAQGIDESGWGTSHFAIAGNALYGEHLPPGGADFLTTPGGSVKVAAFTSLYQCTAAYIYNLNTSGAYAELRKLRRELRQEKGLSGFQLVGALSHYSIRGNAYVDNLRALIDNHQLDSYDMAKLDTSQPQVLKFRR
ncbi:glucosaminidase [Shewanella sp. NFH-SH190041]|uniref:glucosaminidase domain-containing protein n=1 Tax=Shewanella sp. NFH-SH190041 TaxID=2950245 RepID=UPI0021C40513|nr:glucosaminidase domain-containing protein [Shewanella sp. NFH-SH190041]BDM63316.1 glucosaminidase [Shewanella sp. NFH-SH190041]